MKLVYRGAEAALYKTKWLERDVLVKERIPKTYRHKKLDETIRRQRTKQEAILLHAAKKAGVRTPLIHQIDLNRFQIGMEWLGSQNLKKILNKNVLHWCKTAGEQTARLHESGIVHGDLTTSNWMVHQNELVLIDFGLGAFSNQLEDQAVDVLNFKKTYLATHFQLPRGLSFFLEAYQKNKHNASHVLARVQQIEQRTRYS